ncbi:electron transporter, partial [Streptomyces pilosus]
MGRMRSALVRPWTAVVLVVAVAGGAFGLYWFQPWKLWQDETVREELPEAAAAASAPPAAPSPGASAGAPPAG